MVSAGFGYAEVMNMPWTQARDFGAAQALQARQAQAQAAQAVRAASLPAKDWERWWHGTTQP